jgi:hypothetical protein
LQWDTDFARAGAPTRYAHRRAVALNIGIMPHRPSCRYARFAVVVNNRTRGYLRHLRVKTFSICRHRVAPSWQHRASPTLFAGPAFGDSNSAGDRNNSARHVKEECFSAWRPA